MKLVIFISLISLFSFFKPTQNSTGTYSSIETISYTQDKPLEQSISDGEGIYSEFCMRCHLGQGEGVEDVYPPLAQSNWLSEKREESIKSVKFGLKGEIEVNGKTYNNNMAAMGLTDREVADVMNYIMHSFGNETENYEQVTLQEVSKLEKD
jgi:mono/diheme cytochrome c family protein